MTPSWRPRARGLQVLLDDGLIGMTVTAVDAASGGATCVVNNTSEIGERKGVNLPGALVALPALSAKVCPRRVMTRHTYGLLPPSPPL